MTRVTINVLVTLLLGASSVGCKQEQKASPSPATNAAASSSGATAPSGAPAKPALYSPGVTPIPTGPALAILPGQGLGAIRFGATADTVERLMEKPCDSRDEKGCRYFGRAVEFLLEDGIVHEIRIHRLNRPAEPKPRIFGVFNGRFPEGPQFGMYREFVVERLGAPLKVEPIQDGGGASTVEVHHYADMRIEYDRLENGNVVLGGVVLLAPKKPNEKK